MGCVPRPPAGYEIRVAQHLDRRWSARFAGLTVTHEDDGTTRLSGPVTDQAALHGILATVRDLGLTLLSVTAIDPGSGARPLDGREPAGRIDGQ